MATYFYPTTAKCASNQVVYSYAPQCQAPNNSFGGYGGGLDIHDYDGTGTTPGVSGNILIAPEALGFGAGTPVQDAILSMWTRAAQSGRAPWYIMRQTDFKDWAGLATAFTRPTDLMIEIDFEAVAIGSHGGFRDEPVNTASPCAGGTSGGTTPYGTSAKQGNGVRFDALYTNPTTHLEVVVASQTFEGVPGVVYPAGGYDTYFAVPRQVVQLLMPGITPAQLSSVCLRVRTEQYESTVIGSATYAPAGVNTTIRRIGLTPVSTGGGAPTSLKSSGKKSAAMTTG